MSSAIVKPNREPDYVDAKGGYYWFNEGLFLSSLDSQWYRFELNQEIDRMVKKDYKCKSSWCECTDDSNCPGRLMDKRAERARRDLITKSLEDAIFGTEND